MWRAGSRVPGPWEGIIMCYSKPRSIINQPAGAGQTPKRTGLSKCTADGGMGRRGRHLDVPSPLSGRVRSSFRAPSGTSSESSAEVPEALAGTPANRRRGMAWCRWFVWTRQRGKRISGTHAGRGCEMRRGSLPCVFFVGWSCVRVKVVAGDCAGPVVASSRFRHGWVGKAGGRVGNLAASAAVGMRTFAFAFDGS